MIVAIDTNCVIPGKVGGIESYTVLLAEALSHGKSVRKLALITRPENHALFSRYQSGACEAILVERPNFEGKPVANWQALEREHPEEGRRLLAEYQQTKTRMIQKAGVEVIHFPGNAINPLDLPFPAVLNVHDLQHRHYPEYFSTEEIAHREEWWRASAKRAEAVIASSQYVADDLYAQWEIPRDKLCVVPPPVNAFFLEPPSAEELRQVREKLNLRQSFFFYPAHAWPHKNHARLIEAFAQAALPNVQLLLTGGGQENPELRALAEKHAGVRLMGYVNQAELRGLYHSALALVFASEYEASSFPIMEAMASGCPVASSNVTSLPELVGSTGILFDPADIAGMSDAMRRLAGDEALRQRLSAEGKTRAQHFCVQAFASGLERVYTHAIAVWKPK